MPCRFDSGFGYENKSLKFIEFQAYLFKTATYRAKHIKSNCSHIQVGTSNIPGNRFIITIIPSEKPGHLSQFRALSLRTPGRKPG